MSSGGRVRQDGTANMLAEAYLRAPGGYIAFLDETYEVEQGTATFYLLSGVVAHRGSFGELRAGLRDVVGTSYWHTTEKLRTPEGREQAVEVAQYLGDGPEVSLVALKRPLAVDDSAGDDARAECFGKLGSALCYGSAPLVAGVHLMILEKRRTQRDHAYDAKIVRDLRASKTLCRVCQMKQVSPQDENLLWLPDIVSSAVRRRELGTDRGDSRMFDAIEGALTML